MGRAKGQQAIAVAQTRGAASISTDPALLDIPLEQAAGPEATKEDMAAYALATVKARSLVDDEEVHQRQAREEHRRLAYGDSKMPSRLAIEAALASLEGQPLIEHRNANAHLPWSDVWQRLQDKVEANDKLRSASWLTSQIEQGLRHMPGSSAIHAVRARIVDAQMPSTKNHHYAKLIDKLGPGARSGDANDYTRAELRKLLGFLEREVKGFSDDKLRAMAIGDGLIPKYASSPSHAALAINLAADRFDDSYVDEAAFKRYMRTKYSDLIGIQRPGYFNDKGEPQLWQVYKELGQVNPLVAAGSVIDRESLRALADAAGVDFTPYIRLNEIKEEAEYTTPLQAQFGGAFNDFVGNIKPGHKLGGIHAGLSGGKQSKGMRGVEAFFDPATGDIHLRTELANVLRQGKTDAFAIDNAVSALSHEMFHSVGGHDEGVSHVYAPKENTPEHTVDEGITETLARANTQKLATLMGVWDESKGNLREHPSNSSYPLEVQTANVFAAFIQGELDKDKLADGGYTQPEDLSEQALAWLQDIHTSHGPSGRIQAMSRALADKSGLSPQEAMQITLSILNESKSKSHIQKQGKSVLVGEGFSKRFGQALSKLIP